MSSSSPIKAVHVINTGYVEQHKEHRYGTKLPLMWWVLTSRSWLKAPINAYLIEHQDGLVLFDTGLDPAIVSDSNYVSSALGRFLLRRVFRLHIGPEDALSAKLTSRGVDPTSIKKALISHLHFDHIGGIASIPQADLIVSKAEWQQLSEPHPEKRWVLREHIELPGAKWQPIEFNAKDDPLLTDFDGYFDVMGDRSMVLLPTPGHSPGSMCLLIRSEGLSGLPPLLLVGDLTYELELLLSGQVPGIGDKEQLLSSFAKVRALKEKLPDLVVLPSHDPSSAEQLENLKMPKATPLPGL